MASPAVRTLNKDGVELVAFDYSGLEFEPDGNEDELPSFPVIKITQPTSSMKDASRNAGAFYHSDDGHFDYNLDVVGLMRRDTRALFKVDAEQPSCASDDGIAPRPKQPLWVNNVQPSACAECVFSQWGTDDNPPACKESIVLMVDRNPEGEPDLAQLRISGTSIKPYRQFVRRQLAPKKLPIYTRSLHLMTEEHTEPSKKWFELVIESEPLSRERVEGYVALIRAERARFESSVKAEDNGTAAPVFPEDGWETVEPTGQLYGKQDVANADGEIIQETPGQRVLRDRLGDPGS